MKIRKDQKLDIPVEVFPGDTVILEYHKERRNWWGKIVTDITKVVEEKIDKKMTFTHGILLESEEGEFDANYGLGGMFLNRE